MNYTNLTVGERIKIVRKELSLTQESFASGLMMKRNSITQLENKVRNPSERTLKLIASRYNVNIDFLLSGDLPILNPLSKEEELATWLGTILKPENNDGTRQRIIRILSKLEDDEWQVIDKIALQIAKEYSNK